jgi:surface-anchored protein
MHTMKTTPAIRTPIHAAALAAALATFAAPPIVLAQVAITDVHVDIGLEGPDAGPGWGLHIHDEENAAEYAPSEAWFRVAPSHATLTQPAGAQWSFIGQTPGESIYVLPQGQQAGLPFLGFSSEEVPAATFDNYFNNDSRVNATGRWIGFTVTAVSGPGEFSLWQTNGFGSPIVWASSAQGGLTVADTVYIQEGAHAHFNWGFTELGTYSITLVASGHIGGELVSSEPVSFTFSTAPIPEPSAFAALVGLAGLCLGMTARRGPATKPAAR